jgi:DNA transposition AAA+ family ATPase
MDTDAAVVRSLYEEEMDKLHAQSSVKNFIGVIAARRVRERITAAREHGRPLKVQAA